MRLPTELITFPTRSSRSAYVARRFAPQLQESVLDVGCYEAALRDHLPGIAYTGIDVAGKPDLVLDLEKAERLPFADGSFACVVCVDVLEHLDNLHAMFAELVRVSRRHVIVSLPNCWRDARRPIERGQGGFAHYGLPAHKPQDRHKWFFSLTEARSFFAAKATEFALRSDELFVTEKPSPALVRLLRSVRHPGERYQNRYSQTLWAVMTRS